MRLTDYTDYTLRVLMFCALNPDRSITIAELATSHAISKNHLMKIVNDLANQGVLLTTRGRGGGLKLQKSPSDICIGDVVRASETDFRMVECFDVNHNSCTLTAQCRLKFVFKNALESYLAELDKVTLADITSTPPGVTAPAPDTITRVPLSALRKSISPKMPPSDIEI